MQSVQSADRKEKAHGAAPAREVLIPTATAIVWRADNPFLVLVGRSAKHAKPVLPGGKINACDLSSSAMEKSAAVCIFRELKEEIDTIPCALKLLFVNEERARDTRSTTAEKLRETIVEAAVRDLPDNAIVLGHYGVPDFVFAAQVDPLAVRVSEELYALAWIDCRTVREDSLSAGHGKYVLRYAESAAGAAQ